MLAIFKKEFKMYFYSPIGYIFIFVFLILASILFVFGALMNNSADLQYLFSNINILCLFLVPMLTMRLWADERAKKTDQLLLTAPVKVSDIVIGKFLASFAVFFVTILTTVAFPIILRIFGSPDIGHIIGSYIGLLLIWGAFIAIGLFISSLTESQVIASVITFCAMFLVYIVYDWISSSIPNEAIKKIVEWFSITKRYGDFQVGTLNLTTIIYFLSFVAVFLFLTVQGIERKRVG